MAKKAKEVAISNKVDVTMLELEEKPQAHVERAKVALEKKPKEEKKKANPIIDRIVIIKTRAQKNKIPWTIELEKKMESSTTIGQVKRLWREYIREYYQKATV